MDEQQNMEQNVSENPNPEGQNGAKPRYARRSKEELIAAIDEKIAAENDRHVKMIAKLEESKRNILKPRLTKKQKAEILLAEAMKTRSPEQIAEMFGLDAAYLFSRE